MNLEGRDVEEHFEGSDRLAGFLAADEPALALGDSGRWLVYVQYTSLYIPRCSWKR
jgi:hypothetical protein